MTTTFTIGQFYSNTEIYKALGLGNAGGVRIKTTPAGNVRRIAVMTALATARQIVENPYRDRIEEDVLIYTGSGKSGHQSLSGMNARISQQVTDRFPMYGFQLVRSRRVIVQDPKRWQFLGLLQYLRHYPEIQLDSDNEARRTWIFELLICKEIETVSPNSDAGLTRGYLSTHPQPDEEAVVFDKVDESNVDKATFPAIEACRKKLLGYEPRVFEQFIGKLLEKSGFANIEVTQYSQDGGIDINANPSTTAWPIHKLLIQIQAKRWLHTVGRKEVAELRGSLRPHSRGCLVTTGFYSRAAIIEAGDQGKLPIELLDGFELAKIAMANSMEV